MCYYYTGRKVRRKFILFLILRFRSSSLWKSRDGCLLASAFSVHKTFDKRGDQDGSIAGGEYRG